jgi:hypothetical protein
VVAIDAAVLLKRLVVVGEMEAAVAKAQEKARAIMGTKEADARSLDLSAPDAVSTSIMCCAVRRVGSTQQRIFCIPVPRTIGGFTSTPRTRIGWGG